MDKIDVKYIWILYDLSYLVKSFPMEMDELEALLIEYGLLDDDTKHAEIIGKPAEAAAK